MSYNCNIICILFGLIISDYRYVMAIRIVNKQKKNFKATDKKRKGAKKRDKN